MMRFCESCGQALLMPRVAQLLARRAARDAWRKRWAGEALSNEAQPQAHPGEVSQEEEVL